MPDVAHDFPVFDEVAFDDDFDVDAALLSWAPLEAFTPSATRLPFP